MNRKALGLSLLTLAVGIGSREGAAQLTPLEVELEISSEAYDYMDCPQVAAAPDRSFEVAWSAGIFGIRDVRARHFAPNGSPTERDEVAISPEGIVTDYLPEVTTLAVTAVSTGFRVLYSSDDGDPEPDLRFFRRKVDASGVPAPGGSRQVGTSATQFVMPGPGETLLAGQYDGSRRRLSFQQVDSLGKPAGTIYVLNTRPIALDTEYHTPAISNPVIRPLSDGGWVAVFGGTAPAAPGSPAQQVIRARRFNAAGLPLGPDFDVASRPADPPDSYPSLGTSSFSVAALPGGRFSVVWSEAVNASVWSLRMRSFNAAGAATGPAKLLVRGKNVEDPVAMAADNAGRLLVTWLEFAGYHPNETSDLKARLFLADGTPLGSQVAVSTAWSYPFTSQDCGSVAWTGDTWVITWHAYFFEDLSAIFLRRFR